jgi:hypothetical protein
VPAPFAVLPSFDRPVSDGSTPASFGPMVSELSEYSRCST